MSPLRRPSPPPVIRADVGARLVAVISAALLLAGVAAMVGIMESGKLPGAISEAQRGGIVSAR